MPATPLKVDGIRKFIDLVDSSKSTDEFSLMCVLEDLPDFATKKFFDETIFKLVFSDFSPLRKEKLKLAVELRSRLAVLDGLFEAGNH